MKCFGNFYGCVGTFGKYSNKISEELNYYFKCYRDLNVVDRKNIQLYTEQIIQ